MLNECFKILRNSKCCLSYCEDDPSVSLIPWVFSFAEGECVCGGRLISKEMKDLRWPVFLDWHSHHTHTHRYSVRCVMGERISAGPLHSNACVLPRRSPLSGWSSSSQDVPMKDVDYLSFFFTTLTGAHTHQTSHSVIQVLTACLILIKQRSHDPVLQVSPLRCCRPCRTLMKMACCPPPHSHPSVCSLPPWSSFCIIGMW